MRRLLDFHFGLDGDEPVFALPRYGNVFDVPFYLPAFVKRHPAYFGKIDSTAIYRKALGIPEGIMYSLLFELREPFGTLLVESVPECPVQTHQGLLQ